MGTRGWRRRRCLLGLALGSVLAALAATAVSAQLQQVPVLSEPVTIGPLPWAGGDVALDGDTIVVGQIEFFDDTLLWSVLVFDRIDGAWTETARIEEPSDGTQEATYFDVALDGDTLVVSTRTDSDLSPFETVHVFVHVRGDGTWPRQAEIPIPPAGAGSTPPPVAIAIQGDTLVLGHPIAASLYVWERTAEVWSHATTLSVSGMPWLGGALDIDGDMIVAQGTRLSVWVRDGGAWELFTVFEAFGDTNGCDLGKVAVSGDTVVVGSGKDFQSPFPGPCSVFVWVRQGDRLVPQARIESPTGSSMFGRTVALEDDVLIVGSPGVYDVQNGDGVAFVFERHGTRWDLAFLLTSTAPFTSQGEFGRVVAVDDGLFVVHEFLTFLTNGIRVYDQLDSLPGWVWLGSGLPGSGLTPTLSGTGALQPSSPLQLDLRPKIADSTYFLVAGFSRLGLPFNGGFLVPAPDVVLAGPTPPTDFGTVSLAATWPPGVPAGTVLFLQAWIVDPGGPQGFSASNALEAFVP